MMKEKQAREYLERYVKDKKEMFEKYGTDDSTTMKNEKMLVDAIEICVHHDDWCGKEKLGCDGCYYNQKKR